MKKEKFIYVITFIISFSCLALLLLFPAQASEAAKIGTDVCLKIIIPTLLPFIIISSLIVNMGYASVIGGIFAPFMRGLFNVPKESGIVFILGILSGFPIGAKTSSDLYEKGLCTKTEAERLLCFSNNPSPAFVISAVGVGVIGSSLMGQMLFFSQILSSVICGIIVGRLYKGESLEERLQKKQLIEKKPKFADCFTEAVKSGAESILNICAFIIFFVMLTGLLDNIGVFAAITKLLSFTGIDGNVIKAVLSGFFEITAGASSVTRGISLITALPLLSMILSWSGLSVHCQVFSFAVKSGLSMKPYISAKLLQCFLSGLFTFFATLLFL